MKVDSLDELRCAFETWRKKKRHRREPIPTNLLARARRCSTAYGVAEVVRATRVERSRLFRARAIAPRGQDTATQGTESIGVSAPAFSRLELRAPSVEAGPIVEVEAGSGVKLRLFQQTPEMIDLLRVLCGPGGVR